MDGSVRLAGDARLTIEAVAEAPKARDLSARQAARKIVAEGIAAGVAAEDRAGRHRGPHADSSPTTVPVMRSHAPVSI